MKFLYHHQEDAFEFELTNSIAVKLIYLEPPFNSSLRLMKDGTKLFGISLKNDGSNTSLVERICQYFDQEKTTASVDTFIKKLVEWNLSPFAERVQEAIKQSDPNICNLS